MAIGLLDLRAGPERSGFMARPVRDRRAPSRHRIEFRV